MTKDDAAVLALQAIAFLAEDPDVMGDFLAEAGMDPADMKTGMHAPEIQGAILDLILTDDRLLLKFCNMHDSTPEDVMKARRLLPGGQGMFE